MNFLPRKLRPAIKCHGGKYYLARRIIRLMPEHRVYCEPFAGGLSVLLNKPPANHEIAGDTNEELISFYRILSEYWFELIDKLRAIPYTQHSFDHYPEPCWELSSLSRAARFLTRNRMSRGGLGQQFAWSNRLRGGQPGDANAWKTAIELLPDIGNRLQKVAFRCRNAVDLIDEADGPDTLHYCDPPYLPETRTARKTYQHEMTEHEHQQLLCKLSSCQGTVFLSGYPSKLYDETLQRWRRIEFDVPNHAGQGRTKQRRTEVLWINRHEIPSRIAVPRQADLIRPT